MLKMLRKYRTAMLGLSVVMLLVSATGIAGATALDGVGVAPEKTAVQEEKQNTEPSAPAAKDAQQGTKSGRVASTTDEDRVGAMKELFSVTGIDRETSQEVATAMRPFSQLVVKIAAYIIGAVGALLFVITFLDLAYIAVPPVRRYLYSGGAQSSGGGGFSGGFGGGYGGYGGGQPAQQSGVKGFLSQLISDEAVAALKESGHDSTGGGGGGYSGGFGGGFGGGYGGGFGGGFGGGGQQKEPMKNVMFSYMKKRVFFLVSFGFCAVIFSVTLFTDIGMSFGVWIIDKLRSILGV